MKMIYMAIFPKKDLDGDGRSRRKMKKINWTATQTLIMA